MRHFFKRNIKKYIDDLVKTLKLRSIQFIITISFTGITIIAMSFVGIVSYSKFTVTSEKNASLNAEQLLNQINSNIEYYLQSMIDVSGLLSDNIYLNPNIMNSNIKDQMSVISNTRSDIASLAIFSAEGKLIYATNTEPLKTNSQVTDQSWFQNALNKTDNLLFSLPHVQNLFEKKHDWVVSLSKVINYTVDGKKLKGVLLVDMNYSIISQLCQNISIGEKGYIYIVDSDNNIIYHPKQQLINTGLKQEIPENYLGSYQESSNDGEKIVTIKTVNLTNWKVIAVAYTADLVASKKDITNFVIWVIILSIMLISLIFAVMSAKISEPIKNLEKYMKKVEEGDFNIYIDAKGEDEVVRLSHAFNIMIYKVRYLMKQIVNEQEATRKSELDALQAQINPHFLYNTLDSIVWMAENGKSEDVITMVTALARLFRISISRGAKFITVEQEIEHAKNYLIIQKIRYKNKFNYSIDIEPDVRKLNTLKLILQPLIENAIYHGIEYMQDEGKIEISASIHENKILFIIRDNGLGIDPEKMPGLLRYDGKSKGGSGVGVKNVHERIQLTYGKEFGLEIESELEEGTTIKIWIPIDTNKEE